MSTRRALRWRLTAAALTIEVDAATGCSGGGGEPGQPPEEASASRAWRLKLYGLPPPTAVARGGGGGGESDVPFADAATHARWRAADARADHWHYEPSELAIVVWLFGVDDGAPLGLNLELPPPPAAALAAAALQRGGGAGAVRRARAAKILLDETYPDTQPQDYDELTWLAGVGSRLSRTAPFNFTREMQALKATRDAALRQLDGVARPRARSELNKARVRNATALVQYV